LIKYVLLLFDAMRVRKKGRKENSNYNLHSCELTIEIALNSVYTLIIFDECTKPPLWINMAFWCSSLLPFSFPSPKGDVHMMRGEEFIVKKSNLLRAG
jgi:hypothetical protein